MSHPYALGTFETESGGRFAGVMRDGRVLPIQLIAADAPRDLGLIFGEWERWGPRIDVGVAAAAQDDWRPENEVMTVLPYKPENLYGAGANYRRHVIELIVDKGAGGVAHLSKEDRLKHATELMDKRAVSGKPYVFVAPRGAIAGANEALVLPYDSPETDWELELAVVIGKAARRVPRTTALEHVAGYLIANDITLRDRVDRPDIPQMGMDWMSCKSAPGFKILGPYITPARFVADPQKVHLRLSLNGKVMQDEGASDMIFNVARLIEFISSQTLLSPGDIIMTGSPSGNGTHFGRFLTHGDEMLGEIDGLIGAQRVRCVAEKEATG